jgi:hypothetical protein
MSAAHDSKSPSSNAGFFFGNLYDHYRHLSGGVVFKSNLKSNLNSETKVRSISQKHTQELNQWVQSEHHHSKQSLADGIKGLRSSTRRLKFLMTELDDLLKRD